MTNLQNFVEEIKKLTVVEVSELVKLLEEEFGVSAAAQMAAAPAAEAAVVEEKSSFNIILKDAGASKLAVIKLVKDITGLGLGESKALVDGAPSTVKENVAADEAKAIEAKLKEAGATVELK